MYPLILVESAARAEIAVKAMTAIRTAKTRFTWEPPGNGKLYRLPSCSPDAIPASNLALELSRCKKLALAIARFGRLKEHNFPACSITPHWMRFVTGHDFSRATSC
jgi:hypothetical protein